MPGISRAVREHRPTTRHNNGATPARAPRRMEGFHGDDVSRLVSRLTRVPCRDPGECATKPARGAHTAAAGAVVPRDPRPKAQPARPTAAPQPPQPDGYRTGPDTCGDAAARPANARLSPPGFDSGMPARRKARAGRKPPRRLRTHDAYPRGCGMRRASRARSPWPTAEQARSRTQRLVARPDDAARVHNAAIERSHRMARRTHAHLQVPYTHSRAHRHRQLTRHPAQDGPPPTPGATGSRYHAVPSPKRARQRVPTARHNRPIKGRRSSEPPTAPRPWQCSASSGGAPPEQRPRPPRPVAVSRLRRGR